MSRKRAGSDVLTGGTKDVNPQFMSLNLFNDAANNPVETAVSTPIVRVGPASGNRSIIMEILKMYVKFTPARLFILAPAQTFSGRLSGTSDSVESTLMPVQ